MPVYEYKVVPAPEKGLKGKGVKGPRERFANALQALMNDLGAEGWEYIRADMLPCSERSGLTGSSTSYLNMLVFRRTVNDAATATAVPSFAPAPLAPQDSAPSAQAAEPAPVAVPEAETEQDTTTGDAAAAAAAAALHAYRKESLGAAPKLGPAD